MSRASGLVLLALLFPAGAWGSTDTPAPAAPTREAAWTARLIAPTVATSAPDGGEVRHRFGTRARWNGGPVGLLVTGVHEGLDGRRWLKVMLPRRPNGSQGWIPADVAVLRRTPWRVEVSLRRRSLTVLRDGRVRRRWGVVIGAPSTPTPRGLFAVDERVRQTNPDAFVGSWILHLTAFSDVLDNFGGGPGRIGLHGRGGASLSDPLGGAASHGCVRMDNRRVAWLARRAREGTPVRIRR